MFNVQTSVILSLTLTIFYHVVLRHVLIDGEYELREEVPLAEDSRTDQTAGHSRKYHQLTGEHQCMWRVAVAASIVS